MSADRWTFTPAEVAERMGVSPQTIREQCRDGHIQTVRFGKLYLVPRAEVERLIGETLSAEDGARVSSRADQQEKLREARRLLAEATSRMAEIERRLEEIEKEAG